MKKTYSVLIVEDHPSAIEGYVRALLYFGKENQINFAIEEATSCSEAFAKINKKALNKEVYDLVFLDLSLPKDIENNIHNGEMLGIKIKALMPNVKFLVITGFGEPFRINHLFKTLNPIGVFVKSDLTALELTKALSKVLDNQSYYSKTIIELLRKQMACNVNIDAKNLTILQELSNGATSSEIAEIVHLGISAIDKRKRLLKQAFSVAQDTDRDLVLTAKKNGFI